jgi:YegS/Rv2252/BmrU family lipid kinase
MSGVELCHGPSKVDQWHLICVWDRGPHRMPKDRKKPNKQAYGEVSGRAVVRRLLAAQALAPLAADKPEIARAPVADLWPERRALLIINSKSGPGRDSLLRVREIVDTLRGFGIRADVRLKLRKSQARKEARAGARKGRYDLVIAAGGDGTVESVASGLMNTSTPLGIIPLGTYNNVANSLHVPGDMRQACALLAVGIPRQIDAGMVVAHYMKKPKVFLEISTVGLGAVIGSLGQHVEKARWDEAAQTMPAVLEMSPTPMRLHVDDQSEAEVVNSLLVTVSNTPRAGAGLDLAPGALLDDGRLDVSVYAEMDQAGVVAAFLPEPIGDHRDAANRIRRFRAQSLQIDAARPMPVSIESKIVGVTPVRYTVLPGALHVIAGDTPGLLDPEPSEAVQASLVAAQMAQPRDAQSEPNSVPPKPSGPVASAAQTLLPVMGRALQLGSSARGIALPVAAGAAGLLAGVLLRRRK